MRNQATTFQTRLIKTMARKLGEVVTHNASNPAKQHPLTRDIESFEDLLIEYGVGRETINEIYEAPELADYLEREAWVERCLEDAE